MIVFVCGMHRSGTSALAQALGRCGARLPDDLIPPGEDNPLGFAESKTVNAINDTLLSRLGLGWDSLAPLPPDWLEWDAAAQARARIKDFLKAQRGDEGVLVIKDPRLSRLLPLWHDAARGEAMACVAIICVRNVVEVARSLYRRDGLEVARGQYLWLRYMLEAEATSRGMPRAFCAYDALLAAPGAVIARLVQKTEITLSAPSSLGVHAGLRHHRADMADTLADDATSGLALAVQECLQGDVETADIRFRLDDFRTRLDAGGQSSTHRAARNLEEMEKAISVLRGLMAAAEERIALAEERIAAAEERASAAEERISATETRLHDTHLAVMHLLGRPPLPVRPMSVRRLGRLVAAALCGRLGRLRAQERDAGLIAASGLFDSRYYTRTYPDISAAKADAIAHYVRHGGAEGRNPHPAFDTRYYVDANPDVRQSGMNPFVHYIRHGIAEGRLPSLDPAVVSWAARNPDLLHVGITPLAMTAPTGGPFIEDNSRPFGWLSDDQRRLAAQLQRRHGLDGQDPEESVDETRRRLQGALLARPMGKVPDVSIIIPVHNQIRHTLCCVESLLAWPRIYDFEILIGDDGSSDGTAGIFADLPGIRVIRSDVAEGFLRNCNRTAEWAEGRYLLFLNNDTLVLPNCVDALVEAFSLYPRAGLVGAKLLYPDGALQEAGGIVWADGGGWNFGRNDDPSRPEYQYVREADYCSGAAIALPTDIWRNLGGFDEAFVPAYYEDTDLAFRVRAAGRSVMYIPHAALIHFEGRSCGTATDQGIKRHQLLNQPVFQSRWASVLAGHGMPDARPRHFQERSRIGRILVVDGTTPTPDRDSGSQDTFLLLSILRELGFHVTFVPMDFAGHEPYTLALRKLGVECRYGPDTNCLDAVVALAQTMDAAIVCRVTVARQLLKPLRKAMPALPILFHTVDLHHLRLEREAALRGDTQSRVEAELLRRQERECMTRATLTTVVSDAEIPIVKALAPGSTVRSLPLIRQVPQDDGIGFQLRRGLCFIGSYSHPPNQDAIAFFLESVWPLVRSRGLKIPLVIAGHGVPSRLAQGHDDVHVAGHVPDLAAFFSQFRLSVAPLRYGAGLKGKVLDSLLHRLPVVGTPMAVEGSGLIHERDLLVAEAPAGLAEQIVRLHEDQELWLRLRSSGFAHVRDQFSRQAATLRLRLILDEMGLTT